MNDPFKMIDPAPTPLVDAVRAQIEGDNNLTVLQLFELTQPDHGDSQTRGLHFFRLGQAVEQARGELEAETVLKEMRVSQQGKATLDEPERLRDGLRDLARITSGYRKFFDEKGDTGAGSAFDSIDVRIASLLGDLPGKLFRCASPTCPGYPYQASQIAHPPQTCGHLPRNEGDSSDNLITAVQLRLAAWITRIANRWDRHYVDSDLAFAQMTVRLRSPGWGDDDTIELEAAFEEKIEYDDSSGRVEGVKRGQRRIGRAADEVVYWRGSPTDVATDLAGMMTVDQMTDLREAMDDRIKARISSLDDSSSSRSG